MRHVVGWRANWSQWLNVKAGLQEIIHHMVHNIFGLVCENTKLQKPCRPLRTELTGARSIEGLRNLENINELSHQVQAVQSHKLVIMSELISAKVAKQRG